MVPAKNQPFFNKKIYLCRENKNTNDCFMNLLLCIKRPFIWLSRFRHRCGYGVHSPFAFSLITDVIYEKMPYYAYSSLKEVFRVCAHRATPKSVFVVHGICYSKEMKALWKKWQADERVGITFDLYDVGLLFFDKTKIKQQYIINF